MREFAETDTTNVEISHVAMLSATELASSNYTTFVLRCTTSAHLD